MMNKQIVMIRKEHGTRTPAMIASELNRHAKLVGIVPDPFTGATLKYYNLEKLGITDVVTEITEIKGEVVSVRNVPADVLKTVAPITAPQFGGF